MNQNISLYKQIVESVEESIHNGERKEGDVLPSMNELAKEMNISRETVKKAYSILTKRAFIVPKQGRGFFVNSRKSVETLSILALFDKISPYKQILLDSLSSGLGKGFQTTIRIHNQREELLEYYLDEALDTYDYYLIEPHFAMDDATQRKVIKQLTRVPNRKLIMVDNWIKSIPGNYGAVYQDFDNDIYDGLAQGLDSLKEYGRLNVLTLPSSLYHERISVAVLRFCRDNDIRVTFMDGVKPDMVGKGEVFLVLNSQLESGLLDLVKAARAKNLRIGTDISIISFNEYPVNELVLGGLSTVSSDFGQMGRLIAEMIKSGKMDKVKCDFKMTRRSTF